MLRDHSNSQLPNRTSDAVPTPNIWHHFAATYDGAGGPSAADTIALHVDGAVVASTATNAGSYVAMENLAQTTQIGVSDTSEFLNGKMAGGPLGAFFTQKELTADEVRALYDLGHAGLGL